MSNRGPEINPSTALEAVGQKDFERFLACRARGKLPVAAETRHQTIWRTGANDDIKLKGHQSQDAIYVRMAPKHMDI